ncbi:unnamed protein product [Brachionus calyciflorus]|uniref:FLYWCH-type domain-containing protein n=1 Tax=Brachionus calyciflorus TaxID=104777 RepID=A0A813W197_9BILA|nr:unnamed protein product [Brachionus calyciflorus]
MHHQLIEVIKYFKSFIFETHRNCKFRDLVKLEKCFRLFFRSTRFFSRNLSVSPTGQLTEFQNPNGWKLQIKKYKNEINLAEFMFTSGELDVSDESYNENYIIDDLNSSKEIEKECLALYKESSNEKESINEEIIFSKTTKSKPKIVIGDYEYIYEKKYKDKIYWRCSYVNLSTKRHCKSRVHTDLNNKLNFGI